jgi:hypothetical protein
MRLLPSPTNAAVHQEQLSIKTPAENISSIYSYVVQVSETRAPGGDGEAVLGIKGEGAHPFGSIKRPDFDLRASWIYGALLKLSGVLRGDNRQVGMAGMPKMELSKLLKKGVRGQSRRSEPSRLTQNRFELHIINIVRPLSFDLLPPHCQ